MTDYVNIRIPRPLWELISARAVTQHRSGTAQAIHWLSESATAPSQTLMAMHMAEAQQVLKRVPTTAATTREET